MAEEYLEISVFAFQNYISRKKMELDITLPQDDESLLDELSWDTAQSTPQRTVFFPYRDPSGTITMVMTDGPNCGC